MRTLILQEHEISQKEAWLKELICQTELTRIKLYQELTDFQSRIDEDILPFERQPICHVKLHEIQSSPMIQLTYEGLLPLYSTDRKYNQEIRDYYIQSTIQGMEWGKTNIQYKLAFICFVHFFPDMKIRDLDNRSRKWILDALRRTRLVANDDWQNTIILEKGLMDQENPRVEVFVGESEFMHSILNFIDHLYVRTEQ